MKVKILADGLGLTKDKVYDAIIIASSFNSNIIQMINEYGQLSQYYYPSNYFKDVTIEYRDEVIECILA